MTPTLTPTPSVASHSILALNVKLRPAVFTSVSCSSVILRATVTMVRQNPPKVEPPYWTFVSIFTIPSNALSNVYGLVYHIKIYWNDENIQ